jgi:hypothetical protein
MSGRDYKQLLKLHRENSVANEENFKIVSKLADKNLIKYKKVKYDLIKDFISERKKVAHTSLNKVQQLEDSSKAKKQSLLVKNHKLVWFKEFARLKSSLSKAEDDLDELFKAIETNLVDYAMLSTRDDDDFFDIKKDVKFTAERSYLDDFDIYRRALNNDLRKFRASTLDPVFNLNEDLRYYISVKRRREVKEPGSDHNDIKIVVKQVREQQNDVLRQLEEEFLECSAYIEQHLSGDLLNDEVRIQEGIPTEAVELNAPDNEFKELILNEFLIVDEKYNEKLALLDESHKDFLESHGGQFGGWSPTSHDIFQQIYEQYTFHNPALTNCTFTLRDLLFDRVKSVLEMYGVRVNRSDCVKHEEWLNVHKYNVQQRKLVVNEWREARRAILLKAEAIFEEAFEMIEMKREKKLEREKQMKIRQQLHEKMQQFREQKMKALEIQQHLDFMLEEERREAINVANEKERKRREALKQDVRIVSD